MPHAGTQSKHMPWFRGLSVEESQETEGSWCYRKEPCYPLSPLPPELLQGGSWVT